jgi:hypothetical protein
MKTLFAMPSRIALVAVIALVSAIARPESAAASTVCPPPPKDLAALIAVDATYTGPLTDVFPPIYGHYAEGAANCWGDAGITVRGVVARPDGLGGTRSYKIEPDWLVSQSHFLSVSDKVHPDSGPVGPFFEVAVPPALEARFARMAGRWVTVSGHFHDPAAESCVVSRGAGGPLAPTTDQAVEICRTEFVITTVRADELPSTDTAPVSATVEKVHGALPPLMFLAAVAMTLSIRRLGGRGRR